MRAEWNNVKTRTKFGLFRRPALRIVGETNARINMLPSAQAQQAYELVSGKFFLYSAGRVVTDLATTGALVGGDLALQNLSHTIPFLMQHPQIAPIAGVAMLAYAGFRDLKGLGRAAVYFLAAKTFSSNADKLKPPVKIVF